MDARAEGVGEALYVAALRLADLQKVIVKKGINSSVLVKR